MRAAELKERIDIVEVARRRVSGLEPKGSSLWACCPFHEERSPSFKVDARTQRFRCFGCGASGDAIDLVSRLDGSDFKEASETIKQEVGLEGGDLPPPRPRAPAPPKGRIPRAEVEAFWDRCTGLDAGTGWPEDSMGIKLALFMARRRLHPWDLAKLDIAREVPPQGPWPEWWPGSRWPAHRLAVVAYDAVGVPSAIHTRAVDDSRPKTRWPDARRFGYACSGLFFADKAGLALLRGSPRPELKKLLIVEGLTDFLASALATTEDDQYAVLGGASGSFPALAEVTIPAAVQVIAATDDDQAGDRYAAEIAEGVSPIKTFRMRPRS